MRELRYSEDAASRRIRAARVARRFPAIFEMVADGQLHLTAICLLAPRLTDQNSDELLAAAVHRSRAEIEFVLAGRFPQPDLPTRMTPIASAVVSSTISSGTGAPSIPPDAPSQQPSASAPARMIFTVPSQKIAPLAPERFGIQVTVSKSTHDKLRRAQELLSHRIPNGNLAEVLDAVLDLALVRLEKLKFGASKTPRNRGKASTNPRHIPVHLKNKVWERDGGQCTFVADNGHRCASRWRLEFDHAIPVAQGGEATVANIRLRCRAHNQLEARRAFGAEFVRHRVAARRDAAGGIDEAADA
jgi:hypothetical protein